MNRLRFSALAAAAALSLATLPACGGSTPRVEPGSVPYYMTQGPLTPVDIRDQAAYDLAHIAHAVRMEGEAIPEALARAPRDQPVVVCGEGAEGKAEERAAAALTAAGFQKVSIMKGGMAAYLARKLHTQSTADDESAREILDNFRKKPQPSSADMMRDSQSLKERIKIEKPQL